MAIRNNIISKELNEQLRSVTFNANSATLDDPLLETVPADPIIVPEKKSTKIPSLNKRIVTLEYLDKLENATSAQARYESIKEFSHLLSNLSIVLLSISIITYLVFYFISDQSPSIISLLIIAFEAFALLGATLYAISKTSQLKELADLTASDFSTCSHIIGNPQGESYIYPKEANEVEITKPI